MSDLFFTLLGFIIGFSFWQFFAGKYEGDKLKRSIRFRVGKYYIHIHHWFIAFVLLVLFNIIDIIHPIIIGFFVGSIIQGLKYRDRFLFIYKISDFEKIYSKWKK